MAQPNLEQLRITVLKGRERVLSGHWNNVDRFALMLGVALTIWLQLQIYMETRYSSYGPSLGTRLILVPLSFISGATCVYAIWYIPQLLIAILKEYWWIVLSAVITLFVWAHYIL